LQLTFRALLRFPDVSLPGFLDLIFRFTFRHSLLALSLLACSPSPGRDAYVSSGCSRCHGSALRGGQLGPSLERAAEDWSREQLRAFLKDPSRYQLSDDRLKEFAGRYPTPMPAFDLPDETVGALLSYLLNPLQDPPGE